MSAIAILGIHTGIGKTVASAVIAEAMGADYWKPVQAGTAERDSEMVSGLLTDGARRVHPEALLLTQPMSPHAAARIDNVIVDHTRFTWPVTDKLLLVETAGGILSPMSDTATMADFVQYYKLPSILITQNYLGSINHTLMSVEVLRSRGIALAGIIVSGDSYESSETFIEQYSGVSIIGRIPLLAQMDHASIKKCADALRPSLVQALASF
jgi:dethiobiotin synthetase